MEAQFEIATEPDICGNRARQSWSVRVYAPPVIQSFVASKTAVIPGESITLTAIFQGSGEIFGLGPITSGIPITTPALNGSTDFTLVVTNSVSARVTRTLTIELDIPPAVMSTNPVNGAMGVPVNHAFYATFNKKMDGATINSATFVLNDFNNNPVNGTVSYFDNTAVFMPATLLAAQTPYSVTITDGVRDLAGNSMAVNYVSRFATSSEPDVTRPQVASTFPPAQSKNISLDAAILVTFNESVDPSSVGSSTFILRDSNQNTVNGTIRVANGWNSAEFMPSTALADSTIYTAIVTTQIKDLAGNTMTTDYSWTFTTGAFGTWQAISTIGAPTRNFHTAVWTGSEMVLWGGSSAGISNTGARYNPSTDAWIPTSTAGAPRERAYHTAIWTGSEMVVWGGSVGGSTNTGGRYNPVTNAWAPTSTTGAPSARENHTAIWTGSEMVIWGGIYHDSGYLNTGARYNPTTDSWRPISTNGAPSTYHNKVVWTGNEMIVWGGFNGSVWLSSGARYNPVADVWTPMAAVGAPPASESYTATWSGSEMIVRGHVDRNTGASSGARYNPVTDAWVPISIVGAPAQATFPQAIWASSEMIVWGGWSGTSARYFPATDTWHPISNIGAPTEFHNLRVWTGSEMIVWGGNTGADLNTGSRYRPQ
jgi:hypothetical protein